jgi:hypothetical protein
VVNWRQNASLVISGSWKSEHNWELNCWHVPFCMQTFQFGNNVWRITRIRAVSRIRNQYTKNQIWTSYFKYKKKTISYALGIYCFLNFIHCLIFKGNLIFGPVIESGSICAMQLSSISHTHTFIWDMDDVQFLKLLAFLNTRWWAESRKQKSWAEYYLVTNMADIFLYESSYIIFSLLNSLLLYLL